MSARRNPDTAAESGADDGTEHDRRLARGLLAMTPRERLEELARVDRFVRQTTRLDR